MEETKKTPETEDTDKIEGVILGIGKSVKLVLSAMEDKKLSIAEVRDIVKNGRENIRYLRQNWQEIRAEKADLTPEEVAKLGGLTWEMVDSILG